MTDFPFKSTFMNPDLVKMRFENLKNLKNKKRFLNLPYNVYNIKMSPTEKSYMGKLPCISNNKAVVLPEESFKYGLLELSEEDYFELDNISGYFVDELISKAVRKDQPKSPFDWYQLNKHTISSTDPYDIREEIFKQCKEVGTFRPTVIVSLLHLFFPDVTSVKMLDFSSGWGDRFIGAMAAGVQHYIGVDPNTSLPKVYKKMAQFFKIEKSRYKFYTQCFEDTDFGGYKVDCVITSPPYFDLEKYCDEPTQSSARYPTIETWVGQFLMPSVIKAFNMLNVGGIMVIILNQENGIKYPYVLEMVDRMNKLEDSIFLGLLSYADVQKNDSKDPKAKLYNFRSPQPMWVWKKGEKLSTDNELNIESFPVKDGVSVNVVQDAHLIGGTKQRAIGRNFLKKLKITEKDELVYAGSSFGFGQVVLGLLGKKYNCLTKMYVTEGFQTLFRQKKSPSARARMYGVMIECCQKNLADTTKIATDHASSNENIKLLQFGVADLSDALTESLTPFKGQLKDFKNVWLVAGSCTILKSLYKIFPKSTHFHVVQVGRTIWPDLIEQDRTTIYVSPEPFGQEAKSLPPYTSIPQYDAKLWQFVQDNAKNGDLIWNVAGM